MTEALYSLYNPNSENALKPMKKSLVISEQDSIAAMLENDRVVEFFVNRGELLLGDIYSASVENILPGIDAAFVNLGKDKMGFLHANDVPGQGPLKERLVPKQKLLVQITKEPTGHKGPRVSTAISLPGRFLVLVPEERGVSISRRISEARERARLKSVVNLMKPPGVGLIIRTEAKGQGEQELFEDFEALWDRWQTVVSEGEASIGPTLIYRDQDLLFRVIRDAFSHDVTEIICDTPDGMRRAQEYLQGWAGKQTRVSYHNGEDLLVSKNIDREIEAALSDRAELPSGGHLNIQPTEALTVIDVNSGRFTSSRTQAETVRRTNLEAAQEIPRQLRLRNIGGMVIVDFIDMDSRKDKQQVLEVFQRVLEEDRAKPQIGQLSDLGLVELTRRRQGQSLRELFTVHCTHCTGMGVVPTLELGTAENRRVISFKPREEEASKGRNSGRRPSRQGGAVLRAASASNGRIMPTVEEAAEDDESMNFVPEEILEQMPDELLGDAAALSGKSLKRGGFDAPAESDEDEDEVEELTFEVSSNSFAPHGTILEEGFVDDDDVTLSSGLSENISAVEQVYQDMDARSRIETVEAIEDVQDIAEGVVVSQAREAFAAPEETFVQEEEKAEDDFSYEAASRFETHVDPVTGVYRLKAKESTESAYAAPSVEADQYEDAIDDTIEANLAGDVPTSDVSQAFHQADGIDEDDAVQGSSQTSEQLTLPLESVSDEQASDNESETEQTQERAYAGSSEEEKPWSL